MSEIEKEGFYNGRNLQKQKNKKNTVSLEEKKTSNFKYTFEKSHQAAISEVSSWPDWQVKSMKMLFPERKNWKINGQLNSKIEKSNPKLTFEKSHQAAISEVSSWPDWQVKSMQMLFPERKDWKIKKGV